MGKVQFICLANSWKIGGRCVAGLRLDGTGWIRPVSGLPDGTLFQECRYANGAEVVLLDIVEVEVMEPKPVPHQPENWLLGSAPWRLLQQLPPSRALQHLAPFVVSGPMLLGNLSDSVEHCMLVQQPAAASLALVEPSTIQWHITTSPFDGRRRVRCSFGLAGTNYDLSVTDPVFVSRLAGLTDGYYPRESAGVAPTDRVLLTVSLGEPFPQTGRCYKLVAGVLILPGI